MGAPVIVAVGLLAATAAAATGVVGYITANQQARLARRQAEEQARLAEERARQVQQAAAHEEYLRRQNLRRVLSTQGALYGKSSLVMEGTPLAVVEDTISQAEQDIQTIKLRGQEQASLLQREAGYYRMSGSAMAGQYRLTGWGSLLSGVGQAGAIGYDLFRRRQNA